MSADSQPNAATSAGAGASKQSISAAVAAMSESEYMTLQLKAYLLVAFYALIAAVIAFTLIAIFFGPLTSAKILVACIFASLAIVCAGIWLFRKRLLLDLIEIEEVGYLIQEETVVNCREARAGLLLLQDKLTSAAQPHQAEFMPELLRNVGPLVSMLMKKEKSTLNWVMFGLKLGKSAFDAYRQRK